MNRKLIRLPLFAFCATVVPMGAAGEELTDGLYARFVTDRGEILAELFYRKTPLTVTNFVGLAEGAKESNKPTGEPFYNDLTFHRVIDNFMIQGGCPEGTGRGDPGYRFPDEFRPELRHDSPGILSMANAGPATNGSQFFITHVPTPWLDDNHSVFGKVVKGMEVVNAIRAGDKLKEVVILRVGEEAAAFKADEEAFQARLAEMR